MWYTQEACIPERELLASEGHSFSEGFTVSLTLAASVKPGSAQVAVRSGPMWILPSSSGMRMLPTVSSRGWLRLAASSWLLPHRRSTSEPLLPSRPTPLLMPLLFPLATTGKPFTCKYKFQISNEQCFLARFRHILRPGPSQISPGWQNVTFCQIFHTGHCLILYLVLEHSDSKLSPDIRWLQLFTCSCGSHIFTDGPSTDGSPECSFSGMTPSPLLTSVADMPGKLRLSLSPFLFLLESATK